MKNIEATTNGNMETAEKHKMEANNAKSFETTEDTNLEVPMDKNSTSMTKFLEAKLSLTEILKKSVSISTAHAISRVGKSERDLRVRVLWLLLFFAFLGLTIYSSATYIARLNNPSVQSEFQAEKVDFEFPDVYFCNTLQAAGSFTYLLSEAEAAQVTVPFQAANATFTAALASMNATAVEAQVLTKLQLLSLIQSLPFKSLADIVGQRKLQTFYKNQGIFTVGSEGSVNNPVRIETLYHPNHLKCFKLALTEAELSKMVDTNNRIQFYLLLDPYFTSFYDFGLYAMPQARLPNFKVAATGSGDSMPIFPFDWDLEDPLGIDRGSGMFMYLVPRGHYPSRLTSNLVSLAPGRAYDIAVRMSDSQLSPDDFPDQCVDQHEPVRFFNPYTGAADVFSYSNAFCYYAEIARDALRKFNCSLTPQPLPWEFRHLKLCLNLTAARSWDAMLANMRAAVAAQLASGNSSNSWDQLCSAQRLCLHRKYDVTSSYGMWPNSGSLFRLVSNIMSSVLSGVDPTEFRSLIIGVRTLSFVDVSNRDGILSYEDGALRYFQRASLRVTLRAEASRSPLVTFSLDYSLSQFISDLGGALGLYLGCSLLTLLELLELLHDCWPCGFKYYWDSGS